MASRPTDTRRRRRKGMSGRLPTVVRSVRRSLACAPLLLGLAATGLRAETGPGAEVHIVDLNLRAAVEKAVGVQPGYAIRRSDVERLLELTVSGATYDVLELTGLEYAVNLERLDLRGNRIADIGPLASLHRLRRIELDDNGVTDIAPLAANEGIGPGDVVFLGGNPLSAASMSELIPALESKGVYVGYLDDHGDTVATATDLDLGDALPGGLDRDLDVDYFGFVVSSAADVAVFTTGADTQGHLQTGFPRTLASDSGSGARDNFLIRQHLQPGTYYIRVSGARGPYTIHAVEGVEVSFPDSNLRARVAEALGDAASDGFTATELATLTGTLDAGGRQIRDLAGLEFAVNLTDLRLDWTRLRDITELSSLINLGHLDLERNAVTDLAPLVANPGIDAGDQVYLARNPLSDDSVTVAIPALEDRGVFVGYADDHGNNRATESTLMLGGSATGSIYPTRDQDVFRLRIPSPTDVVVYTTGSADTVGVLYDAEGTELVADDRTDDRTGFLIARSLEAGDYFVQVRGADPESTRGAYLIAAHEDPNASVLPDVNLRAVVADALNRPPEAEITAVHFAALTSLRAAGRGIANLSGLEMAVNLTHLDLDHNRIADIGPLSGLLALEELRLAANTITDVSPLIMNPGLGDGDRVFLQRNPLSRTAANEQLQDLAAKGVSVVFADDHGSHRSTATVLELGQSSAGSIHHESDRDLFRLNVAAETDVAVFTIGDANVSGRLYDANNARLAVQDYRGADGNIFFRATLAPGSYYVEVDGDGDSLGTYVIHAIVDEPARIPDDGLRTRIALFFSAAADTTVTTGDLASLQMIDASNARISNLAGLEGAVNLRRLSLRDNRIEDVQALSGLTRLVELDLEGNAISDIAPLAANGGLGQGDKVVLSGNPLDQTAQATDLPALEDRGVFVGFLDDHGDRSGNATALPPGGRIAGALSTVDDEDVFRLAIAEATDVSIVTTGATNTRGLLAGAGSRRLAADLGSEAGGFVIRRRLDAGVYYVTVSGSGGLAGVGPYVLQAAVAPTATPANIAVMRDGSSLVVTWDPVPADLAGGPITRYRVIATPSDGGEPIGCTASPDAGGCTIVGLADGVDYAVTVHAVNAVGFGPAGAVATPGQIIAVVEPLTSFWRGWRLSLAPPPPEEENVGD